MSRRKYSTRRLIVMALQKAFALGFASFLICSPASAFYSTNDFLRDCQAGLDSGHSSFCLGFITGALESIQFVENIDENTNQNTCKPNNIDLDLVVRTFIPFARAHPEFLNGPAVAVLRLALIKSYPAIILCPKP